MILITFSPHSQISQNYKITKLIIIVVLIVIIIIIIMITIIIISYHYQFLNQLKQMTFCCCRCFCPFVCLFFSLSKLEGLSKSYLQDVNDLFWFREQLKCHVTKKQFEHFILLIGSLISLLSLKKQKKQIHMTTWLYIYFAILEGKHSPSPSS